MKKKLTSILISFALVLTGAMCLAGCGETGVNLHNKTYTMGTEITYKYYTEINETKTDVANPTTWLNDNWEQICDYNSSYSTKNKDTLIDEIKTAISSGNSVNDYILLKGAKITVGKENVESESVHTSTFNCEMNEQLLYTNTIKTDTFNKDRKSASLVNVGSEFNFDITDYEKSEIKNVYVKFRVVAHSATTYYSNVVEYHIYCNQNTSFVIQASVNLATVI